MDYDAIFIGAGQALPSFAAQLAKQGKKVAIVEKDRLGGTCLNYGCRPTKALRASALVAHTTRKAGEYGVNTGRVEVDFEKVMARKDSIIEPMQQGLDKSFAKMTGVELIYEPGQFESKKGNKFQLSAGDKLLTSNRVYINVGARARIPDIKGLDKIPFLTNKDILNLKKLPQHLMIIGGGYVGLEFGQMFRRFGSEVTIIQNQGQLLPKEDEDVAVEVNKVLKEEGIKILLNAKATSVESKANEIIELTVETPSGRSQVKGSHLLVAAGRIPNSDTLNTASVGLKTDKHGYITVNDHLETNVPGIWALGDVNGRGAFTHTSYQDYEILLDNQEGGSRAVSDRTMAYAVFIDPPLGRVGMNEQEARKCGRKMLMANYAMKDVTRAKLDSAPHGIIKVLVDKATEKITGALAFGMQGDDVIQVFSNFMATGASYKLMERAMPIHPTVAEFIPTILKSLKPLQ